LNRHIHHPPGGKGQRKLRGAAVGVGGGGGDELVGRDGHGQGHVKHRVAVASVVTLVFAQVKLAFAVAAGVGGGAVVEIQGEGGVGVAVERALNAVVPLA
jgi:hypothetical protein